MTEEHEVSDLRHSSKIVGKLYPVLLDADGNIIDGQHRLVADSDWPAVRLFHIRSEKERLLARLISNACRRTVSPKEKKEMLGRLGAIYLKEGGKPGKLAYRLAEETGMSYTWVMKYLPDKYKLRSGFRGPSGAWNTDKCQVNLDKSQVTQRVIIEVANLLSTSGRRSVVVKTYTNANFVNLSLEKRAYENLDRLAERLGVTAETIIANAVVLIFKEIDRLVASMNSLAVEKPMA